MEEQVPPSQQPGVPQITPEQLAQMKARARELAIQQTLAQKPPLGAEELTFNPPNPQVVYVRRNLTIAEIVLLLTVSCLLVTGVQFGWKLATDFLPRVEIKVN
jgi:hypothetical protein|tara:strand:+ start:410 stop:718 length:309 start_codon:yes stop_codon:yes gene_type:complete